MSHIDDISLSLRIKQYESTSINFDEHNRCLNLSFQSTQPISEVRCPYCSSEYVEAREYGSTTLRDMPIWIGCKQYVNVRYHRYRCRVCNRHFTEDIFLKHPNTRVTERAAVWIKELIRWHMSIASIQEITGIHWETICNIQKEYMEQTLDRRKEYLKSIGYKPKYLAVDEFAIHKGHTYATCVMDLAEGDILWVGKGRAMEDFRKFFSEIDMEYISEVRAIAMDMNASYNTLVEEYLPNVAIVYDRYHMQAQYGKDVLGSVRLAEARGHLELAKEIDQKIENETDPVKKRRLKKEAQSQRSQYTELKKSRWPLLMNKDNLSEAKSKSLNDILEKHSDLAVCYAMKEDLCDIFEVTDPVEARRRWEKWFEAAKTSGIPALVKFGELKEKRIEGLVNHAIYHISTGKLEGLNNKIKVTKRIGYGYRNDPYFFTLIQYLSIPNIRLYSPKVP